ncbi:MAG: Trm112 family protein [Candidatus Edwardsbacteria bacterium]
MAPQGWSNNMYCCPSCKGQISRTSDSLVCTQCRRQFPIVCGIPDFRIFRDDVYCPLTKLWESESIYDRLLEKGEAKEARKRQDERQENP